MTRPLEGIRVFDWTNAAVGPIATELLGGLGADVIKIESPDGEIMSTMLPTQRGSSTGYASHNFNKRSITLGLKDDADRLRAYQLLETCDVFVENFRPGVADRLGMSYEDVAKANPRIIYVSASAWGTRGPMGTWPGADPNLQAYSGWSSIIGQPGQGGAFYRGYGHIDATSASYIAAAVMHALIERKETGRGANIEIEMLSAAMNVQMTRVADYMAGGQRPNATGSADMISAPNEAFRCVNQKYIAVSVETEAQWRGLCEAIRAPELATDARFASNALRLQHRQELTDHLVPIFLSKPTLWWTLALTRNEVPNSLFYDFEILRDHAHVLANDMLVTVESPYQGAMMTSGHPWRFSECEVPVSPAPKPGEHTAEVLASLSAPRSDAAATEEPPAVSEPGDNSLLTSFRDLVVVDATQGVSGAYTTLLLREGGAQVTKIEPPEGDYLRYLGPPLVGDVSAPFFVLNRGKRSATLDLSTEEGCDALKRILATADVFVEDMGPDLAKQRGLDHATLKAINPRLVQATVTPFGEFGPLKNRPGSELTAQALADYPSALGTLGEPPIRVGADIGYMNTGIFLYQAILAALYQRYATGTGQRVSANFMASLIYTRKTVWTAMHDPDDWAGNHTATYQTPATYGYRTKDGFVYWNMRRASEEQYYELLGALGILDQVVDDPRFGNGGRDAVGMGVAAEAVKHVWEDAFKNLTTAEIVPILRSFGAEGTPVNNYDDVFASDQVKALELTFPLKVPGQKEMDILSPPYWLNGERQRFDALLPALGEHTDEVLKTAGSLA